MADWTAEDLQTIGDAHEVHLSSLRLDDTLRPPVTIWVVRVGNNLYVRSGYGRSSGWFRRAQTRHLGAVTAGGTRRDVIFVDADRSVDDLVTAAYHAKYDGFGSSNVSPMVAPDAVAATLKLVPR